LTDEVCNMPYDAKFYETYQEYLKEPTVRKNHDHVFRIFAYLMLTKPPCVMDLGCGIGEYAMYDPYHIHMHTPSQMFGPDVIEVWKIFVRK